MLGTRWFEEHAKLFGWMAGRHDVDWTRVDGPAGAVAVRHAVNTCLSCREVETCREAHRDPQAAPAPADFCPNSARFDSWSRGSSPVE